MKKDKKAIVLGGTIPHKALIENLRARGYYTILIDYLENPPAKPAADQHVQESTLDKEKVLEIAQEAEADLVISTSIDQANATACFVAERLGLPKPYSYETALAVTNKLIMKQIMRENGIPTPAHTSIRSLADADQLKADFPMVIKPADSTGSKGVRKADNFEQLQSYLNEAFKISRSGEAIVETFYEGQEVQVDFFVQHQKAHLIMTRHKVKVSSEEGMAVLQSVGSIVPADISDAALKSLEEAAAKIVKAFHLDNTSLFVQAIVSGDQVNVIEFACRIGGGLSFSMINIITGFDILDATVDSYLGVPVAVQYKKPDSIYSTSLIYTLPGSFGRITGYEKLLEKGTIEEFYLFKTKGMPVGADMTSGDRVGAFLVKADDRSSMWNKTKEAFSSIAIFDVDENEITRRDFFQEILNTIKL